MQGAALERSRVGSRLVARSQQKRANSRATAGSSWCANKGAGSARSCTSCSTGSTRTGEAIAVRVVAVGGDRVVTAAGPFQSVLRPGQMVTTRTVGHYKGDTMTGTIEARYASGDVVRLKTAATRKK